MSDECGQEVQEIAATLMNFGEKEIRRVNDLNIPRLILGRDFGTFDPWTKQDLEDTFNAALRGNAAAESRLLNSAATSDGPASRYVTWLYALLFWFREHPEHLTEVENVLRLGRERGIATPTPEIVPRESYPAAALPASTEPYLLG